MFYKNVYTDGLAIEVRTLLIFKEVSQRRQKIFYTEEEILLSTTLGKGLIKGAIRSCTAKKK